MNGLFMFAEALAKGLRGALRLSCVFVCMVSACLAGATNSPPNVVLIFADDLGNADIGYNAPPGSMAYTPNIDRICNEGVYMANHLTHHNCSPSRAGMLTGRHYSRVGSGLWTGGTLDNSRPNIAKDFQAAGYTTGAFGKWHNGMPNFPADGNGQFVDYNAIKTWSEPHRRFTADLTNGIFDHTKDWAWGEGVNAYGFDRWVGYYNGGGDYFDRFINWHHDIDWWHDRHYVPDEEGYTTDLVAYHSATFIETNAAAGNPFFCYVPHEAVHAPIDVLRSDLEEMCNIVDDEYPELAWTNVMMLASPFTSNLVRDVEELRCSTGLGLEFDTDEMELLQPGFSDLVYYTMVYSLDKAVGTVLDKIDEMGVTTNTIVIFTSDNGGTARGDNTPFRGNKHEVYEGGIHVPAAIWWPSTLDAHQAPYSLGDNVYSNMTQYLDWYPTLINMVGATVTSTDLDGVNLTTALQHRTPARVDFENGHYDLDNAWASVRTERWKLHFNRVAGDNQKLELYDLWNDIGESNNVASIYPAERDIMIGLMDQWFASGEVTASYMPVTGDSRPPYSKPAPSGDILEISATQTDNLASVNSGVYVSYSSPDYKERNAYDVYVQAGDVLEYDIYIAEDSDHMSGIFCSPSRSGKPLFNSTHGMHPSGAMLTHYAMPKGEWIRVVTGPGDICPSDSNPQYISLCNVSSGSYHFYIDNAVIRRNDGTIRAMIWNNGNDSGGSTYYRNNRKYTSWADAVASAGFPLSDLTMTAIDVSVLDAVGEEGTNFVSITPANGIGIDYPVWADNATDTTGNGSNSSTGNAQVGDIFGTDNVRRSVFAFDVDDSITPDRVESAILKLYYRGANENAETTGGAVSLYHSEAAAVWSGSSVADQRDLFNLALWSDTGLNVVSSPFEAQEYKEMDVTAQVLADMNGDPSGPAVDGGANKVMSHFLIRWDNEGTFDADLLFDAVEGSVGDPVLELTLIPSTSPTNNGSNYSDWIAAVGGIDELDPNEAGPTNQWSLMTEYGLGSDPSTYTAGFSNSTNLPNSQQLGMYTIKELLLGEQNKGYLTMSFDFNREAKDVEIVLQESTNLVDWVNTLVITPPYSDAVSELVSNSNVVEVADNVLTNGYPVETTRITARAGTAVDDEAKGFLKLVVRPTVSSASTPLSLNAVSHDGILLEWAGGEDQALFIVERALADSNSFVRIAETDTSLYTDTTAVLGQAYDYRIRAINVAGASSWSNIAGASR